MSSIENDLYDYEHRVDGVIEILDNCRLPFIFSVEGEWGRGKSTLVDMIVERITNVSDPNRKKWEIVHYHPWRFDIQEFGDAWESLVEILHAKLRESGTWGKSSEEILDLLIRNRWTRLIGKVGISVGRFIPGGSEAIEGIGKGFGDFFKDSPAIGPKHLLFERIREKVNQLLKGKQVLLVIDDLDRCSPSAVSNIIRCIPTLFAPEDNGPNIAILLCIDRNATRDALVAGQGVTSEQAEKLLEKLIQVHVTLPILQLGRGDQKVARDKMAVALTSTGHRQKKKIKFPTIPQVNLEFEIRPDQVDVIAKFMNYNPRKFERFCLLYDLKWKSRFLANSQVFINSAHNEEMAIASQVWLNKFRDRLIWETIIELRWPSYDSKNSDLDSNRNAILQALRGDNPNAR